MQGQADLQLVARLFVGEAVGAQSREGIREILTLQLFLSVMIGPVLVLAFRRDGIFAFFSPFAGVQSTKKRA